MSEATPPQHESPIRKSDPLNAKTTRTPLLDADLDGSFAALNGLLEPAVTIDPTDPNGLSVLKTTYSTQSEAGE